MSTRMGDFKQLMPFRGRTFVAACLESIRASSVDDVVVVTGHRADEVAKAVAPFGVRVVHNPDYASGMSTSVLVGLAAIDVDAHGMLVALCDQPHVRVEVFDAVLDAYRSHEALVVVPTIAGDSGHPVIFDLSLRDEILDIDPASGLRSVTYAHRSETLKIGVDDIAVLDDIDTMDDYERLR